MWMLLQCTLVWHCSSVGAFAAAVLTLCSTDRSDLKPLLAALTAFKSKCSKIWIFSCRDVTVLQIHVLLWFWFKFTMRFDLKLNSFVFFSRNYSYSIVRLWQKFTSPPLWKVALWVTWNLTQTREFVVGGESLPVPARCYSHRKGG